MKTPFFLILLAGFTCFQAGFALTTLNLPVNNDVYVNPVDNLSTLTKIIYPPGLLLKEIPAKSGSDNTGDTIVIDLAEVVITSPFPANSRKCILEQVPYPFFAQKELLEGGVAARFVFDEQGVIQVLETNSTDPRLERYVVEKLEGLSLS